MQSKPKMLWKTEKGYANILEDWGSINRGENFQAEF